MLPGKVFGANSAANVMQFVIDENTYYITEKMVYDALTSEADGTWYKTNKSNSTVLSAAGYNVGTSVTMAQGHNYTLTITVNKTGIANVTATLEPWVNVAGDMTVNNAHITLSLKTTGSTCNKDIDLYRLDDDYAGYDADQFSFSYEGKNWFGNYTTDANHKTTLEHSALANGKWTTPWFFESNKTYYHFRTVNKGTTIKGNTNDDQNQTKDYFEISASPTTGDHAVDPHWGAPMKAVDGTTWLKYDTDKGYEAHLHHAIGATESQIAIQELHMMSNIEVVLETPNNGGKVQLYKPAVTYTADEIVNINGTTYVKSSVDMTNSSNPALYNDSDPKHNIQKAVGDVKVDPVDTVIKITRLAKNGTVEMGRGVVTPTAPTGTGDDTYAKAEVEMTSPAITTAADYYTTEGATNGTQSNTYTYAVVPQSLSRDFSSESDDDYVGIFIQTPDNNQYYVVKKLSEIYATTVSDQRDQTQYDPQNPADAAKIKRWYPGHKYTYTFTITKTGITNVTCTVADWVTVTGANTKIDLES